ncbi:hypothetical protein EDD18DRAFT_1105925 [Armillaria luteobubalina]|uniref:Uncharacterized protein n=1 Tax=Armillaria luteobubalina TaxID=153913 RepID=A0AA39Q6X6_9AGAR|nr:hypothetical protein EDD18DRAFT_1105925 [Armillaria luteobubalina]
MTPTPATSLVLLLLCPPTTGAPDNQGEQGQHLPPILNGPMPGLTTHGQHSPMMLNIGVLMQGLVPLSNDEALFIQSTEDIGCRFSLHPCLSVLQLALVKVLILISKPAPVIGGSESKCCI